MSAMTNVNVHVPTKGRLTFGQFQDSFIGTGSLDINIDGDRTVTIYGTTDQIDLAITLAYQAMNTRRLRKASLQ